MASLEKETKSAFTDQTENLLWKAIAFGQSTDLDYNSTILPEKVGTNYVYPYNSATNLASSEPLPSERPMLVQDIAIESRGGKISEGHDGLTFYYTEVPTTKNFILTGTMRVEQIGPENAAPNQQEGAGLMVRDVIGGARQDPLWEGYEEYPAASNIAAILVDGAAKSIDTDLTVFYLARYGVDSKEGTATSVRSKGDTRWLTGLPLAKAVDNNDGSSIPDRELANLTKTNRYQAELILQLERTNETFIMRMLDTEGNVIENKELNFKAVDENVNSNIVENIESDVMYVGFFASRNARVSVKDISLELAEADTVETPQYKPVNTEPAVIYQASGDYSNSDEYTIQALTNYDGVITVIQDDDTIGVNLPVTGGQQFQYPVILRNAQTEIMLNFAADASIETEGSKEAAVSFKVNKENYNKDLYVSPTGSPSAAGTAENPLDMAAAIEKLVPGGTIYALPGTYGSISIDMKNSGSEKARKTLVSTGEVIIASGLAEYQFILDGDYWNITGLDIDGRDVINSRGLYIYGSHNQITSCVVHNTKSDAGVCITSSTRSAYRALWPSYNLVEDCESFKHIDESEINADGYASKSQSGDFNVFRRCVAYENADDGWDLFNKLAEGKNGTTIIEDCIAFHNGNNGFKLGGESLPVRHEVRNCVSYCNGLDGFTDNFNPGDLQIKNNTSFNNTRFNYIFRPSPYIHDAEGNITAEGTKINNVSFRTSITDATYSDKIFGETVRNNFLVEEGHQEVKAEDFVSLNPEEAYQFVDGRLVFGDFLRLKADSPAAEAGAGAHLE